jgi:hypothetical protein
MNLACLVESTSERSKRRHNSRLTQWPPPPTFGRLSAAGCFKNSAAVEAKAGRAPWPMASNLTEVRRSSHQGEVECPGLVRLLSRHSSRAPS